MCWLSVVFTSVDVLCDESGVPAYRPAEERVASVASMEIRGTGVKHRYSETTAEQLRSATSMFVWVRVGNSSAVGVAREMQSSCHILQASQRRLACLTHHVLRFIVFACVCVCTGAAV